MPELPEVETVRRSLVPYLDGARIDRVTLHRKDLRTAFPRGFARVLAGRSIERIDRRAKYLLFRLSGARTWLVHLGMTGTFRIEGVAPEGQGRYFAPPAHERHDHVVVEVTHPALGRLTLIFSDARRFGSMSLIGPDEASDELAGLGPEPLSSSFGAHSLAASFRGRKAPVKLALLDQRAVAGLGNIYASEALHRAHIRPTTPAGRLVLTSGAPSGRLAALAEAIPTVLRDAIEHGGSTLRDFRSGDGARGAYQDRFAAYGREGKPCPTPRCPGTIRRIVQSGRSSYFCPVCQKA